MSKRLTGRARQQRNARILAASDVCHICGHAGADEVDHVDPFVTSHNEEPSNLRPAHGQQPCTTCGRRCNREKGAKVLVPGLVRTSRDW